jgi:hypothetical protein
MIDSLAQVLASSGLRPESFTVVGADEGIFRGEVQAGRVVETYMKLAKGFPETKYWPIIRGISDISRQGERDPAEILASAPAGNIREILEPRIQERRETLDQILPEFAFAAVADLDRLAQLVDESGIYTFSGYQQHEQWPTEAEAPTQVKFRTATAARRNPSVILLVRVEHPYEVPAYLEFGGWNDCPAPGLQVAVLREWHKEYNARPACITGDVLECVLVNRPQTEAESMKLAADQWIFCEDIVAQGTQTVRKLAMEIWRSPTWFFWWD